MHQSRTQIQPCSPKNHLAEHIGHGDLLIHVIVSSRKPIFVLRNSLWPGQARLPKKPTQAEGAIAFTSNSSLQLKTTQNRARASWKCSMKEKMTKCLGSGKTTGHLSPIQTCKRKIVQLSNYSLGGSTKFTEKP